MVSNCNAQNNRLEYARQLGHHISVDIYGDCGTLQCGGNDCLDTLGKKYKFYLAFENSNCADYITEKFWNNALNHDMLPIVMGAPISDYKAVAPPNSFIHVDSFAGPEDLAKYLHVLDQDDDLYNGYFAWKGQGNFFRFTKDSFRKKGQNSSLKIFFFLNLDFFIIVDIITADHQVIVILVQI